MLKRMARPFIAFEETRALDALKSSLERIGDMRTSSAQELLLQPLRTEPSVCYEPGPRSGGVEIYARISGKWELQPVIRVKKGSRRKIQFVGKASTVVELWEKDCMWREEQKDARRVSKWRMELGAHDSPGCYFHIQVLGDRDEPPFPKSIPIPRLPSPFVTPMAAVEFVLGELFQDKWERAASLPRDPQRRWRSIQMERWTSMLKWQEEALTQGSSSPWMNLKKAKPRDDLFLPS